MTQFLSKEGVQYLVERLVELIDQKTQINIVSTIDSDSTNQEIAGAKAVYDLLTAAIAGLTHLKAEVVQSLPATGEDNIIYLVKIKANTYQQWMYINDGWFDLGTTEIDLSGYWAKDELWPLTNTEIQEIIDEAMEP